MGDAAWGRRGPDERSTPGMLQCERCGRVTLEHERGWRALHGIDEDDRLTLQVRCAECTRRELDEYG